MVVGTSCFGIAVHRRSWSGAISLTCPLLHANPRQIKRTSGLQKAKRIVLTVAQLVDYLVVRPFISVSLQLRPRPKRKHLLFTQRSQSKSSALHARPVVLVVIVLLLCRDIRSLVRSRPHLLQDQRPLFRDNRHPTIHEPKPVPCGHNSC